MIDFTNGSLVKLSQIDVNSVDSRITAILAKGETVHFATKGVRDSVAFTSKRIIVMDVQGVTGKKTDITTLPYSKISAYSVESAGTLDMDSEVDVYISGVGKLRFEFSRGTDTAGINQVLAHYVL